MSQELFKLEERYQWARRNAVDIVEHLPTIREAVKGCRHVTEFGVRTGFSTCALAAARPEVMRCYDILPPSFEAAVTRDIARGAGIDFKYTIADSRLVEIEPTDILMIDTVHCYECCIEELRLHGKKVAKKIIFHDTEIFGKVGDDGKRGLLEAIREFMGLNPEWCQMRSWENNCGLTIIEKAQ